MKTGNSERVRGWAARTYIEPARKRGETRVRIVAGEVQKALRLDGRTPQVCNALRSPKFLEGNRLALESWDGPPSGQSTTVTFTYRLLPRTEKGGGIRPPAGLDSLWGLGKAVFESLGGGEAFIRGERARFHDPATRA